MPNKRVMITRISILRSQELLEVLGVSGNSNSSQPCKLCGHSENILYMLICDNGEEAFHASCCNPRVMIMPIDEWFCHNCSKSKSKVSLETTFLKLRCISLKNSRLRTLINQILNWQHQLCRNPKVDPEIKTLFVDHAGGQPNGARASSSQVVRDWLMAL